MKKSEQSKPSLGCLIFLFLIFVGLIWIIYVNIIGFEIIRLGKVAISKRYRALDEDDWKKKAEIWNTTNDIIKRRNDLILHRNKFWFDGETVEIVEIPTGDK